jgi:hypothetical protein
MPAIFPRGLIHPLKQVASLGYLTLTKAPLWMAHPLQQRLGPSSRKPIGEGNPLILPTIGTANPSNLKSERPTRRTSELF